jgi:hypothetical protein
MTQYKRIGSHGERFRVGERISSSFVEPAASRIVNTDKRQSMRWRLRGTHQLVQTMTWVLSGDLGHLIRRCQPGFRKPAGDGRASVL